MKKRLLTAGLILLAAIVIAPAFRNVVREVIVIPLLYMFWIGRFIFEAIPQIGLWGAFFTICLLILGVSLLVGNRKRKSTAPVTVEAYPGRVEGWAHLIDRAAQDDYFKWRLAQQLQKLALSAVAHQKGQSFKQTRQQFRQGDLDMSPELKAYFQASLRSLGHLPSPKRFYHTKRSASSPLDLDPIHVVRFLESINAQEEKE